MIYFVNYMYVKKPIEGDIESWDVIMHVLTMGFSPLTPSNFWNASSNPQGPYVGSSAKQWLPWECNPHFRRSKMLTVRQKRVSPVTSTETGRCGDSRLSCTWTQTESCSSTSMFCSLLVYLCCTLRASIHIYSLFSFCYQKGKNHLWGWNNSVVGRGLALHATDTHSIFSTIYCLLSPVKSDHWVNPWVTQV